MFFIGEIFGVWIFYDIQKTFYHLSFLHDCTFCGFEANSQFVQNNSNKISIRFQNRPSSTAYVAVLSASRSNYSSSIQSIKSNCQFQSAKCVWDSRRYSCFLGWSVVFRSAPSTGVWGKRHQKQKRKRPIQLFNGSRICSLAGHVPSPWVISNCRPTICTRIRKSARRSTICTRFRKS